MTPWRNLPLSGDYPGSFGQPHLWFRCLYFSAGVDSQGEQENTSSWLGKLVRTGMSQIPFQLKIPEKWLGHQVLTSVGVFFGHILWKLLPFSHARVISWSSTVSNLRHCRKKKSLNTIAKYHLKQQQQKANDSVNWLFHNFQGNHRIFWNPSGSWGRAVLRKCPPEWQTHGQQRRWCLQTFLQYLADATLFLVELVPASCQALYLLSVPHPIVHPTPKSLTYNICRH